MSEWLSAARPDLTFPQQIGEESDIRVAYCPERVLPGRVVHELVNNDRVIGGLTRRCSKRATDLYKSFVKGECFETTARTAEMCKLTENAFRDVNIAFANELSMICDELQVNVWELIKLANRHPRVSVLQPGPGVGGHCIAVDPWFIVSATPNLARIIRTAREINDYKPHYVVDRIAAAAGTVTKPVIAVLGLAFKPDIDDLRESPAVEVVKLLSEALSSDFLVVEPHIAELPNNLSGRRNVKLVTVDEALQAANIVVMLVSHTPFYSIDRQLLSGKVVIDTRGVWQ
jgi:UDP-N-acetyl-D-mannosaminuronic acid dehydrogenase